MILESASIIQGTVKVVAIFAVLAVIAVKPDKFVEKDPFFAAQTWTLKDAYLLLIPVMAIWWAMFIVFAALAEQFVCGFYMWYTCFSFAWAAGLLIYILLHLRVLKPYSPHSATFGLDKAGLTRSTRILTIAIAFSVFLLWGDSASSSTGDDLFAINSAQFAILMLTFFVGVVGGPLLEEFLFRGVLYTPVYRKLGKWKAICCVSFVNLLMHLQFSLKPEETILPFCFFILFGYIYQRNRSLYGSIALHMGHNCFWTVLTMRAWPSWNTVDFGIVYTVLIGIGFLLLVAVNLSKILSLKYADKKSV